jgi:hypothetical protein
VEEDDAAEGASVAQTVGLEALVVKDPAAERTQGGEKGGLVHRSGGTAGEDGDQGGDAEHASGKRDGGRRVRLKRPRAGRSFFRDRPALGHIKISAENTRAGELGTAYSRRTAGVGY